MDFVLDIVLLLTELFLLSWVCVMDRVLRD